MTNSVIALKKLQQKFIDQQMQLTAIKESESEQKVLLPLQCCCEEMKHIFEERQSSLEQIGEHWKNKTQILVSKIYKSLQMVREDYDLLKANSCREIQQLQQMQG